MLELLEREYKGPPEVITCLGHPLLVPHHTRSQSSERAGIVLWASSWIHMDSLSKPAQPSRGEEVRRGESERTEAVCGVYHLSHQPIKACMGGEEQGPALAHAPRAGDYFSLQAIVLRGVTVGS